jgi:hypothetical protein
MVNSVFIFIISDKRKGVYLSRMLKVAKYMETLEKSGATVNGSTYEKSIRIHANNTKLSLTHL